MIDACKNVMQNQRESRDFLQKLDECKNPEEVRVQNVGLSVKDPEPETYQEKSVEAVLDEEIERQKGEGKQEGSNTSSQTLPSTN